MTHLARRLVAMVSIAGGGLLGAAPTARAAAPDPTPSTTPPTSQAAATPGTTPAPPPVTLPLRTGRAVPDAPSAPAAEDPPDLAASATLRTGRAADLATPAPAVIPPVLPAVPARGAPTPDAPTRPAASSPPSRVAGPPAAPLPTATPAAAAPPPSPGGYSVVAGDSLWSIAASQVAQRAGGSPGSVPAAEVVPYWQQLCNANRASLRSGDVNVIYPGEQITLPPMSG